MKNWKHIAAKSTLGLLLTGALVSAYLLGSSKRRQVCCNKLEITIVDSIHTPFVSAENIRHYLSTDYGKTIGVPINDLDLYKLEKALDSKDPILKSDAFVTSKGTLNIVVVQRKPIIEFKTPNNGFYCDKDGFQLPLKPDSKVDAMLIEGDIPQESQWMENTIKLVNHINSSIWKDKISRINCNEKGELVLFPKSGREQFIFGHPEDIERKFENMQVYYERIVADKGEGAYNVVDLRFKKQIICKDTEQKKKK